MRNKKLKKSTAQESDNENENENIVNDENRNCKENNNYRKSASKDIDIEADDTSDYEDNDKQPTNNSSKIETPSKKFPNLNGDSFKATLVENGNSHNNNESNSS